MKTPSRKNLNARTGTHRTARCVMNRIVSMLLELEMRGFSSPTDPEFLELYGNILQEIELYQRTVISLLETGISCSKGCSDCCCHWVEDVNSFEAQIIADFVLRTMPEKTGTILKQCREDCIELDRLEKLLNDGLNKTTLSAIDPIDLLLNLFYRQHRPCPFLDIDGTCSIYPVRPLTCRIYVSFSDPLRCSPEYTARAAAPGRLIDLSPTANEILDRLHFRYQQLEGDTGLRSQMTGYLSDDKA